MKRITLEFPDTRSLWAFAQALQTEFIQINSIERRLTCYCTDEQISIALLQHHAQIIDEVEARTAKP